ncbi:unnamed protein product [Lasius platythorax]|uniref:Mediator of RNA polymerase II transcription subunit 15 n=1 Tax=Lasius platythorax TaxID=488582 RepID=A0AAV2NZ50_9HYME
MAETMANDLGITESYRQSVRAKIDEAIQMYGMLASKNSIEMENHVYQKAKSKEEYVGYVVRLILKCREMSATGNAGINNQGIPNPFGAPQTLARQETGNNQMMDMGDPSSYHNGIISQSSANTATNISDVMCDMQALNIAETMPANDSWKTESFRQSVRAKIDEAIQMSGIPTSKNSIEMENHVYQKAKSKEQYVGYVARLILEYRKMSNAS